MPGCTSGKAARRSSLVLAGGARLRADTELLNTTTQAAKKPRYLVRATIRPLWLGQRPTSSVGVDRDRSSVATHPDVPRSPARCSTAVPGVMDDGLPVESIWFPGLCLWLGLRLRGRRRGHAGVRVARSGAVRPCIWPYSLTLLPGTWPPWWMACYQRRISVFGD